MRAWLCHAHKLVAARCGAAITFFGASALVGGGLGLGKLVEIIGLALVADQVRVARAAVIIHVAGLEVIVVEDEQADGLRGVLRVVNRFLQALMRIDAAIHTDDFHSRGDSGVERRATVDGIGDGAIGGELQTDGIGIGRNGTAAAAARRLVVEEELPAAIFDAASGGCGRSGREALVQKAGPIVGDDLIEGVDDVLEGVGLQLGTVVRASMKEVAEIINGFLSLALAMDDGGDFEP